MENESSTLSWTHAELFYKGTKGVFGYFNIVFTEHYAFKDLICSPLF